MTTENINPRANIKSVTLPMLSIREMALFPGIRMPFAVRGRASALTLERSVKIGDQIILLTQKDPNIDEPTLDQFFSIGCLARIESLMAMSNRYFKIGVHGLARVRLRRLSGEEDCRMAQVEILDEPDSGTWDIDLRPGAKNDFYLAVDEFFKRNNSAVRALSIEQVRELPLNKAIDAVAALLNADLQKQRVLEQVALQPRLAALMELLQTDKVNFESDQKALQRLQDAHENFIRKQKTRVIREEELGRKDEGGFKMLRQRILEASMSEEAQAKALEELERLEDMDQKAAEAPVIRTYIDWLLALPWAKLADERLELGEVETALNQDHAGLDKVKARIIEYLAVMRQLRCKSSGQSALRGPILCLVGPPGVGKTSLARSIARAMNRPFVRFSLGGIRDEAEIRGHRKVYIGSMPGRIISLIKKAGVKNPLILLDELDKMASNNPQGDPAAALLEVLDPEQNSSFQDNYLDVGFDLSQALFFCTANVRDNIPEALGDRLDFIELSGYTPLEKNAIAQNHLAPKLLESHGLNDLGIRFEDKAIEKIIQAYTKEAGVRQLGREIAAVLRKLARHRQQPEKGVAFDPVVTPSRVTQLLGPEKYLETPPGDNALPGVVNGLVWTASGGDLLTIEATRLPGKGGLKLTGNLGEVMQESAEIALTYIRARAERYGLDPFFSEKTDIHIHVPKGGVPKDGPSAGITMAAAILSALTGIPVKPEVAMTGELTLNGMVLQIGGLKEKLFAAHRLDRKVILIPRENARDLEDIPEEVKNSLTIRLVSDMDEVIQLSKGKTIGGASRRQKGSINTSGKRPPLGRHP